MWRLRRHYTCTLTLNGKTFLTASKHKRASAFKRSMHSIHVYSISICILCWYRSAAHPAIYTHWKHIYKSIYKHIKNYTYSFKLNALKGKRKLKRKLKSVREFLRCNALVSAKRKLELYHGSEVVRALSSLAHCKHSSVQ